ncbi:MAG: SAM-dependent chlorinase/fluorinase [Alphaproteobacteria bacterium]|nr:SAM-dependent chlorinase/fluorinase [Alphaproteobacteria bacterium]
MKDRTLVTVLADYGHLHDLAFAEVRQRLYAELGDGFLIETVAVPAFDTVATGFVLAQMAINSRLGANHKFFVNTAPRKDDLKPRARNAGEGLAYAKLVNGVEIVAVDSGHSLSFIRDAATEMRGLKVAAEGSQFRSRDVFAAAFAKIAHGDYSAFGSDLMSEVREAPQNCVCYTDGYGNMKCALDIDALMKHKGKDVCVTLHESEAIVRVADGIFGVADGQFCLSPGSSGWALPGGKVVRFAEIVKRGGNAAKTFDAPHGGAAIEWRPLS